MKEGLFTVDLKKNEDGKYNFGYIDAERFSTPLVYMPVRSWNQWIVEISGYTIGQADVEEGSKGETVEQTMKALIGMLIRYLNLSI